MEEQRWKYHRIKHLPFSEGKARDDQILTDTRHFEDRHVVVTCKLDGECTTFTRERAFARSPDSDMRHPSRTYAQHVWSCIRADIPNGWKFVGENVYAQHSIAYRELPSYFMLFAIFDENNICFSWDETKEWADLLGLETVDEIWDGKFDRGVVKMCNWGAYKYGSSGAEGFVVRVSSSYHYNMSPLRIAKYVRKDHVTTDKHWLYDKVIPNGLRPGIV